MAKLKSLAATNELGEGINRIALNLRAKAIPEMLNAAGDVLIRHWQQTIEARHHVVTGSMRDSVSKTDIRFSDNGAYIEVYPMGTDSHTINNATKAFILHYGRKGGKGGKGAIKGDKFVTEAERKAKGEAIAAMQEVLNKYIAQKG